MNNPLKVIGIVSKILIVFLLIIVASLFIIPKAEYVEGTGEVVAEKIYNVYAPIAGSVEKVYLEFGDMVSKDDVIAKISVKEIEKKQKDMEINMNAIIGRLKENELNMNNLKKDEMENETRLNVLKMNLAELKEDKKELQFLVERGERAEKELRKKENEIKKAEIEYSILEKRGELSSRKEFLAQQEKNLKEEYGYAKEQREEFMKERIKTEIKVPESGLTVITRNLKELEGSYINKGALLCTLADINKLKMVVGLNERGLGKVREGQKVKIFLDSIPYEKFTTLEGKVSRIYPQAKGEETYNKIEVEIEGFTNKLKADKLENINLKSGLKGKARIEVKAKKMLALFIWDKIFE